MLEFNVITCPILYKKIKPGEEKPAPIQKNGFSTKVHDRLSEDGDGSDLIYYGYRHYSPKLGRFISRDPIEEYGGVNLFAFVDNNPINHFDWIGLLKVLVESKYQKLKKVGKTLKKRVGSPLDCGCIWDILWDEGKVKNINNNQHFVDRAGMDGVMGYVDDDQIAAVHDKHIRTTKNGKKIYKLSATIAYWVNHLAMNTDPNRSPPYDYWGIAQHELMHIQSLINRFLTIAGNAKGWEDEVCEDELDKKKKEYEKKLKDAVIEARKQEQKHNTSGGHGTPAAATTYPNNWHP